MEVSLLSSKKCLLTLMGFILHLLTEN